MKLAISAGPRVRHMPGPRPCASCDRHAETPPFCWGCWEQIGEHDATLGDLDLRDAAREAAGSSEGYLAALAPWGSRRVSRDVWQTRRRVIRAIAARRPQASKLEIARWLGIGSDAVRMALLEG